MSELAHHPRGRFAGESTHPRHRAVGSFEHHLDARVAQQPLRRGASDHRPVFDQSVGLDALEHVDVGVDHDRGPVLILVTGETSGAEGHERVGPASADEPLGLLAGHDGDLVAEPIERLRHHRPLCRRELAVDHEPLALVGELPLQPACAFGFCGLVVAMGHLQVARSPDRARGNPLRPTHERVFIVERSEPGQLDDLVDAEIAARERVGGGRERGERPCRRRAAGRLSSGRRRGPSTSTGPCRGRHRRPRLAGSRAGRGPPAVRADARRSRGAGSGHGR